MFFVFVCVCVCECVCVCMCVVERVFLCTCKVTVATLLSLGHILAALCLT